MGLGAFWPTSHTCSLLFLHSCLLPLVAPQVKLTLHMDEGILLQDLPGQEQKILARTGQPINPPQLLFLETCFFVSAYKPSAKHAVSSLFCVLGTATCCPFPWLPSLCSVTVNNKLDSISWIQSLQHLPPCSAFGAMPQIRSHQHREIPAVSGLQGPSLVPCP